ncbi:MULTISPECIES: aldose 1-epimerase [Rhizobium]|uniref:aldose epimerase family protein n=1 Tax=Rhizobium TaxID=379 RepID=UPI00195CFF8A|nr:MULTISPECIES: aldose 1-epimerase [Rhizobium]MBM7046601.1 aldose 1-epimerase [Rhizobium lusitanum]
MTVAFSSVWSVVSVGEVEVMLSLSGRGPGPFVYDATMTYRLEGPSLVTELTVTNRAAMRLPYGAGFHPWFVREPSTLLKAGAKRVWLEQPDHLPLRVDPVSRHPSLDFSEMQMLPSSWTNNWFDGWDGKARLEWPNRGLAVDIEAQDLLNRYVVFSPDGDADFVCVEPVTHAVDAFNLPGGPEANGLKVLMPDEGLHVSAMFQASSL